VGDFMNNIAIAIAQNGIPVIRKTLRRYSIATAIRLLIESYLCRNDLIYISYPTEGYGKSLLPFLLAFGSRKRVIIHLHEYSSKNRYCRFLLRFFMRMNKIYFSNTYDFDRYLFDCKIYSDSFHTVDWKVISSPSNIPVTASLGRRTYETVKVIHFGQIRPNKGLEEILSIFSSLDGKLVDRVLIGGCR